MLFLLGRNKHCYKSQHLLPHVSPLWGSSTCSCGGKVSFRLSRCPSWAGSGVWSLLRPIAGQNRGTFGDNLDLRGAFTLSLPTCKVDCDDRSNGLQTSRSCWDIVVRMTGWKEENFADWWDFKVSVPISFHSVAREPESVWEQTAFGLSVWKTVKGCSICQGQCQPARTWPQAAFPPASLMPIWAFPLPPDPALLLGTICHAGPPATAAQTATHLLVQKGTEELET